MSASRNYYTEADSPEYLDDDRYTPPARGQLPLWLEDDTFDPPRDWWESDDLTDYAADELGATVVAVRPVAIGRARSFAGWLAVALLALVGAALMTVPGELGLVDEVMFWMICGALVVFVARGVRRWARRG